MKTKYVVFKSPIYLLLLLENEDRNDVQYIVYQNSPETTNVPGVAGDFYFGSANQRVELNLRL